MVPDRQKCGRTDGMDGRTEERTDARTTPKLYCGGTTLPTRNVLLK